VREHLYFYFQICLFLISFLQISVLPFDLADSTIEKIQNLNIKESSFIYIYISSQIDTRRDEPVQFFFFHCP